MAAGPIAIRLGGYSPPGTTHSRGLDRIAGALTSRLGDEVAVTIDYNILDTGRPLQDLPAGVERGEFTLCYFSSSYLADRVPEIGIIDLPYLFRSLAHAHRCLDGELGSVLSARTREVTGFVPLGYWDNGFRHLSNRHRDIRRAEDCRGLTVRLQPNWAHEQLVRALGAEPVPTDLRDGIARVKSGELDAQENPFANFVTYGIQEVHRHVSLTGHVYGARGLYASARQLAEWPADVVEVFSEAVRGAIAQQRVEAQETELELQQQLTEQGTRIIELTDDDLATFRVVAAPILERARERFGPQLFDVVDVA